MALQNLNAFALTKSITVWLAIWMSSFISVAIIIQLFLFLVSLLENGIDLQAIKTLWFFVTITAEMALIPAMLTSLFVEFVLKRPVIWPYALAGMLTGYYYFRYSTFPGIASTNQGTTIFFSMLGGLGGLIFGVTRLLIWKCLSRT